MSDGPAHDVSAVDRLPFPGAAAPRHLGWRGAELSRPFAPFFARTVTPVLPHAAHVAAGRAAAVGGHEADDAPRVLGAAVAALEDGWTTTARGTVVVACRTPMPGVTAAMWDWWFGWHLPDPARYRLWHPEAHVFAAVADDRRSDRSLTDRQRYVGNVSYVDEYLGTSLHRLAIRFVDPQRLGFARRPGWTHVCARVGLAEIPVTLGWLVHQVRPTDDGAEMRSRFYLGRPSFLRVPPRATARPALSALLGAPVVRHVAAGVAPLVARRVVDDGFARDLYRHCAEEMHHLAGLLPALYAAMRDEP